MNDQARSVTNLWLQRSRSDLALGKAAVNTAGVLPEDACYHAQQSVEKALKGLLTYHEVPFPRTHVLEVLLDLLKDNSIEPPKAVDEAFVLTQYAVQTRYPGEWEPVTDDEATEALERASLVLMWVESQIR